MNDAQPLLSEQVIGRCAACGHEHPTMATVEYGPELKVPLCHEGDHSCYQKYQWEKEKHALTRFLEGWS